MLAKFLLVVIVVSAVNSMTITFPPTACTKGSATACSTLASQWNNDVCCASVVVTNGTAAATTSYQCWSAYLATT